MKINDQEREFVNEVSENLHRMTGTEQRVTSAYHPQSNGLCERQNRTIKESLVKVLDENATEWPYIIEGILFAHRVSRHTSTKYSPFFLLYNREPTLPIDIKHNLFHNVDDSTDEPFDKQTFDAVLSNAISMREKVHQEVGENIQSAQKIQERDYNRLHQLSNIVIVGQNMLLKNQKRKDRKGSKFSFKWLGPYTDQAISKTNLCSLTNKDGKKIKKKYKDVYNEKPPVASSASMEDQLFRSRQSFHEQAPAGPLLVLSSGGYKINYTRNPKVPCRYG